MKKPNTIPELTSLEVRRFWDKVAKGSLDACWPWTGYVTPPWGYGQFGLRYKLYLAHRVAWALTHRTSPDGLVIRHECDNPKCCNPAHLVAGTQMENVRDMIKKGRDDHSKNPRGQDQHRAKLTDEQVREIWRLHIDHGWGQRRLGAAFGVTAPNIHSILSGATWRHLMPPCTKQKVLPRNGRPRKPR